MEMALVWAINMTRKTSIFFRGKTKPKADQCLKAIIGPQARLAGVDGDVFALGGKALDLLDSVEQVSINKTKKDFLKSSQHQSSHFDRLPVLLTSSTAVDS